MGTVLYDQGIFINRCYDELNISQPEIIRGIHRDYVHAGAEVIETNTFGGNIFRLSRHGCGDQVDQVNRAGARLAREVAKANSVFVAGSVGPLGIRIEPLGKTSPKKLARLFASKSELSLRKDWWTFLSWKRSGTSRRYIRRFSLPAMWRRRSHWSRR